MIVAQEKRKNNLAEYILYMWQIEDVIRACNFDINRLDEVVISGFKKEGIAHQEIKNWYENLIEMMKVEQIQKKGHLQIIKNNVNELYDFHLYLINERKDASYIDLFQKSVGNIAEFRKKSKGNPNDIELCLTALYGVLILKLQQKEISEATSRAVETFSRLMASLTAKYKSFEEDQRKI